MKRTDIAMIILIAAVSAGLAYFVANSLLGSMTEQNVKVKTIDGITSDIAPPDPKIFNENAINPSVEVNITNTAPAAATTPTPTAVSTPNAPANSSPNTTR